VFVTETSPCSGPQYTQAIKSSFGSALKMHRMIHTIFQGDSVTEAVRSFMEYDTVNSAAYDFLYVLRNDLKLKTKVDTWTCDDDKINVAGLCNGNVPWEGYILGKNPMVDCINDLLFMAPRKHFNAFAAALGSDVQWHGNKWDFLNCGCFAPDCGMPPGIRHPKSPGHDCLPAFAYQLGDPALTVATPGESPSSDGYSSGWENIPNLDSTLRNATCEVHPEKAGCNQANPTETSGYAGEIATMAGTSACIFHAGPPATCTKKPAANLNKVDRILSGLPSVGYCWPPLVKRIRDANPNYELVDPANGRPKHRGNGFVQPPNNPPNLWKSKPYANNAVMKKSFDGIKQSYDRDYPPSKWPREFEVPCFRWWDDQ
jgi:hypothetical protein